MQSSACIQRSAERWTPTVGPPKGDPLQGNRQGRLRRVRPEAVQAAWWTSSTALVEHYGFTDRSWTSSSTTTSSIVWGGVGKHMRYLRRIGALFSHDAFGYAKALYVATLVVWSVLTIWRVASGALLETPDASPTLIKIDLLEAVAFLAAWSLLLITLTTKVVNKGRDLEFDAYKVQADIRRHEESHPDIQDEVEKIQGEMSDLTDEVSDLAERAKSLKRENERITEENEQLHRQLDDRKAKDHLTDA